MTGRDQCIPPSGIDAGAMYLTTDPDEDGVGDSRSLWMTTPPHGAGSGDSGDTTWW
jgi:hypothetical protein